MSNRDRDFRPSRRRDFDDADYRPPSRNFGYAPPRGPQFSSPSGPPVRAIVKWYSPDKGFGFVELADGSGDAFLHVSVIERSGQGTVPPGATLEIRSAPGPKGPQVTEILTVDASTASQQRPRRARPERPAYPPVDRPTAEELGTVKWYNAAKGFGFVGPDQGGKDIFVHASALDRFRVMGLAEGQRVAVDVADGQKGPEAVRLRLIAAAQIIRSALAYLLVLLLVLFRLPLVFFGLFQKPRSERACCQLFGQRTQMGGLPPVELRDIPRECKWLLANHLCPPRIAS